MKSVKNKLCEYKEEKIDKAKKSKIATQQPSTSSTRTKNSDIKIIPRQSNKESEILILKTALNVRDTVITDY